MAKKRDKKYNPKKTLQHISDIVNPFVVWAIDGVGKGVKRMPSGDNTIVSHVEYPALVNKKHYFRTVAGVCYRTQEGDPYIKYVEFDTVERHRGDSISETITQMAKDEAETIHRPDFLTIFYFTTPNMNMEFTDELIARWIAEAGTWSELITWKEHLQNEVARMSEFLNDVDLDKTQVGGDHYSKLEIQPRHIIVEMQLPWDFGNAIKYLIRYKDKNGSQDLKKAWDYIARLRQFGKSGFPQRRVLKKHKELWKKFAAQFNSDVQQVLDVMWFAYTDKIKDEEHFKRAMGAILFEINSLHKLEYNNEDAF